MIWAGVVILVVLSVAAGCVRLIPAGSIGLVERLGRLRPGTWQPGLVITRPFFERVLVFPLGAFPAGAFIEGELSNGETARVAVQGEFVITSAKEFHLNVPPVPVIRKHDAVARARRFLKPLMEHEGRAILRESGLLDGDAGFAARLAERLDWHLQRVGMRRTSMAAARDTGAPPRLHGSIPA
ncbi:MAG: hypothetical protein IT164_04790 [Bryobacterales bacterium]|nr:hypothetical protein [Bryobacterales bacterium]